MNFPWNLWIFSWISWKPIFYARLTEICDQFHKNSGIVGKIFDLVDFPGNNPSYYWWIPVCAGILRLYDKNLAGIQGTLHHISMKKKIHNIVLYWPRYHNSCLNLKPGFQREFDHDFLENQDKYGKRLLISRNFSISRWRPILLLKTPEFQAEIQNTFINFQEISQFSIKISRFSGKEETPYWRHRNSRRNFGHDLLEFQTKL